MDIIWFRTGLVLTTYEVFEDNETPTGEVIAVANGAVTDLGRIAADVIGALCGSMLGSVNHG